MLRLVNTPAAHSTSTAQLEPAAQSWPALLSETDKNTQAARFREQLGLSTTKPIVMSGHQAQFWHPGILAKLFAAQALADKTGAQLAWLVVDTDTNDALSMRVPVRNNNGPMQDTLVDFVPPAKRGVKKPTGILEAVAPAEISLGEGARAATPEIAAKLEAIHAALEKHHGEASAARQVTRAMFDLLADFIPTPKIVYASEIAETELFDEIRTRAADDPGGFTGAFNDAVLATPNSGVAQLSIPNEELPMWRIDDRGRRQRARASDARGNEALLPGGMLMTGLVRLAGCDLFIHGTGGRDYEPINDLWLTPILGDRIAPFTTATATMLLDFDSHGIVNQSEARRARWQAHHARHEPAMLDEHELQSRKREMVADIQNLPRRSAVRNAKYRQMQKLLEEMRQSHAQNLSDLQEDADQLQQRAAEFRLRTDRTWSAVLHSQERLAELGKCIADEFNA
jgi:hypothetical protein